MHLASDLQQSAGDLAERRALKLVLYDALASEAMGTLTTGVFLVGFAVALGADNFAIGVLAAVPFAVQLLQIPAVLLVERWRARRDICVVTTAIGRTFLLGAAAAPAGVLSCGVPTRRAPKRIQNNSGVPQGLARPAYCRLSVPWSAHWEMVACST